MPKTATQITAPRVRQLAALPWRREGDGSISVLLVTSRTNKKWMLPKGWAIPGKSDAQAAAQEAMEEAGVEGHVREIPLGSFGYIKLFDDGSTKPSQAVVFSLQVTRQRRKWSERGQRRRRWFTADAAAEAVFERDLSRFLTNVATGRVVL